MRVSFGLPILDFFNLYVVHDYYFYAISVFIIFALGYLLACLMRKGSKWGKLLWFGLVVSFASMYLSFLLPKQVTPDLAMVEVMATIQQNSRPDDVLLIYSEVWDSLIAYHAKREALMNYRFALEEIREFDAKMDKVDGWENVRVAIVNGNNLPMQSYLEGRLRSLGFPANPDFKVNGFSIYRKITDP